jgi:hypothetical protein
MRVFRSMMVPSLMLSFVACDPAIGESGTAPLVRDSAGITIVENAEPLWSPAEAWRLSAEPALQIGMMAGPDGYQLYRVAGATRLGDGRIVVANGGTSELRYYGADGRHLASAGRSGGGPGEFQNLFWVGQRADSVLAFDGSGRQMSVFTADGGFVRSYPVAAGLTVPVYRPWGVFADGGFVYGGVDPPLPQMGEGPLTAGTSRSSALYVRIGADGELIDSIGRFAGPEWRVRIQEVGGRSGVSITQTRFAANPHLVAAGDRYVFGSSERYELAYHSSDGRLERLVRKRFTPERVTDEHLRLAEEEQRRQLQRLGMLEGGPAPAAPSVQDIPHAEVFPAFGTFLLDAADNVWVSEYRRPGHDGPVAWDIFDSEGVWLGVVTLPPEFRVFEIGEDYVLGAWRDDLDVEYVQLYQLIKP